MKDFIEDCVLPIFLGLAFAFIGFIIGGSSGMKAIREEAIQHGHAIYNPTNGNFQWKEAK